MEHNPSPELPEDVRARLQALSERLKKQFADPNLQRELAELEGDNVVFLGPLRKRD